QDAQALGLSTVYQEVNLIPHLSAAENIFLGRQPKRWGRLDWRAMRLGAEAAMARLNIDIDVMQPVSSFSVAIQQMVAIARALDVEAKVLVLDEPTASLDSSEVERLFELIRQLKADGLGIVFVTHFLEQVYQVTDRITVLRNGQLVGEWLTAELPRLELVARMMGKEPAEIEAMTPAAASVTEGARQPLVSVDGLGRRGSIAPFSLDIGCGEVVGLAGLLGSGRTEVARLLFGVDRAETGTVSVDDKVVHLSSPRAAMRVGFAFCPEDRKTEAIVPSLSVRENIILALQASRGWLRALPRAKQEEIAEGYIKALAIKTPDAEKPIGQLSGGNQQKAIIARWLASKPRLLILDEPTRGIDVGAKAEVEKLTADLSAEGMAIVFISSELEEVVRASHRVMVLRDRAKVGELTGNQIDEATIMGTIAGGVGAAEGASHVA
ncbi:MAG: sugar ABC transporter ATP-binding protein, partial [Armatimonadetes bacterium]|nr:sugar ABC transporter ATP-binding protein [Armatimonadota bacterium]